jgi:hypothetical protein
MATGDTPAVDRLDETRDTLERGVFVMLFGQFEKSVTEYFEQARDARSTDPDWSAPGKLAKNRRCKSFTG